MFCWKIKRNRIRNNTRKRTHKRNKNNRIPLGRSQTLFPSPPPRRPPPQILTFRTSASQIRDPSRRIPRSWPAWVLREELLPAFLGSAILACRRISIRRDPSGTGVSAVEEMPVAASAIYFLNLRGDVLINRLYRDDVGYASFCACYGFRIACFIFPARS